MFILFTMKNFKLLKNKIEKVILPVPDVGEVHLFSNFSTNLFNIRFDQLFLLGFVFIIALVVNCNIKSRPKLLYSFPLLGQNPISQNSISVSTSSLDLAEGGPANSFSISLSNAPSSNVTIQCSSDSQIVFTNSNAIFTSSNYSTSQSFTVSAYDDSTQQGTHTATISCAVSSADSNYNNYSIASLTVTIADNDTSSITVFDITSPVATGSITGNTIAITVPYGTNVTALVPNITFTGASISPANGAAQDFTNPVVYTVTAADATTVIYTVTVTVASASAKAITAFSFATPVATGTIVGNTISISVPFGTTVSNLVATFTTTGASVSMGGLAQVSGTTPNDFTNPVIYTVTAADATTATYTVTVTVGPNSAKAITAFSFATPVATGTIVGNTITVSVPNGTSLNSLVPSITITGASISPASGVAQNFTSPVVYTVTAADATTTTYTVTVSDQTAKDFASFSFANIPAFGTFSAGNNIAVTVPFGTDTTALVATFAITGVSVKVGATTTQVSGTTTNNFLSPVTYTVTAADTSTQDYIVTVTVAGNTTKSILDFSFASPAVRGSISGTNIAITVPFGTNVTALVPTISIDGATILPASGVAQDFTNPVNYTVTAGDAGTQIYTVTVTTATSANSAIVNGSFQSGTLTNVDTSSTATLSTPVNLSKAFVYCGAQIQSSSADNMPTCQLSSPTTVSIQTGSSSNTTANWFVVEYAFGVTVQRGSLSLGAGVLSNTINLSTIDLTKSFALVYSRTNSGSSNLDEERTVIGYFTDANTLKIERQVGTTLAVTVEWQVVEFTGANVKSSGATPLTIANGSASNTATIGAITTSKSFLFFSYNGASGIGGFETDLYTRGSITNSTTLTFARVGSSKDIKVSWFLVEMTDGTAVQSGSTTVVGTGSNTSITANFGTPVNINKSMIVWSNDSDVSSSSKQDSSTYSGKFNDSNTIQFDRFKDENNGATIDWHVVEFQ